MGQYYWSAVLPLLEKILIFVFNLSFLIGNEILSCTIYRAYIHPIQLAIIVLYDKVYFSGWCAVSSTCVRLHDNLLSRFSRSHVIYIHVHCLIFS